jgi:hypothetical protein
MRSVVSGSGPLIITLRHIFTDEASPIRSGDRHVPQRQGRTAKTAPLFQTGWQPLTDVCKIQSARQQALFGRVAQGNVDRRPQCCEPERVRIAAIRARWSGSFGFAGHAHEFKDG